MTSRPTTVEARLPDRSPDPWVPLATAPPTEMCGNEARLGSAQPSACSLAASSPYNAQAETRTVRLSGSTR